VSSVKVRSFNGHPSGDRRCVMLKELNIRNFALIDDLSMSFAPGLLAMTGETGAGKTIILESLQLLFGKRSDAQMIRHGEERAEVSGTFGLDSVQQDDLGLPEEVRIDRTIDKTGRNQIRINGEPVTLARIREVTGRIGSIHSQNETLALDDKNTYLSFIDQVAPEEIDRLRSRYLMARSDYLHKKARLDETKTKKAESLEKKEFMEYQLKELKAHHLVSDEKESIEDSIAKLGNHDRIMDRLTQTLDNLESDTFSVDSIHQAAQHMAKIAPLDPVYGSLYERLSAVHLELDDIRSSVFQQRESLDFDPAHFERLQERSYELTRIENKYGKSVNDLIIYQKQLEDDLMMINDYDGFLAQLAKEAESALEKTLDEGRNLSKARARMAKSLESLIIRTLRELDLDKAVFDIVLEETESPRSVPEQGLDTVEFMISLNEGEPKKPLSKVASGGERARFMFALKSVYATSHNLSLLILDEIDIGISGKTAAKVAAKMHALSEHMQLVVITHLPQVAARADTHYGITKEKENGRMVTRIEKLSEEERIRRIALMLSDEDLSHFAIEQARTLLRK
jgi:DNA repair protein RecN (Recombination protein N)